MTERELIDGTTLPRGRSSNYTGPTAQTPRAVHSMTAAAVKIGAAAEVVDTLTRQLRTDDGGMRPWATVSITPAEVAALQAVVELARTGTVARDDRPAG